MAGVILAITDETFQTDVEQSDIPVLVDFTATWCGPCQALAPILEQVAEEYTGRVKFAKVDINQCPQTAAKHMIRSVPTLLLFQGGNVAQQSVGLINAQKIKEMVDKVL